MLAYFGRQALSLNILILISLVGCGESKGFFTHSTEQSASGAVSVNEDDMSASFTEESMSGRIEGQKLMVDVPIRTSSEDAISFELELVLRDIDDRILSEATVPVTLSNKETRIVHIELTLAENLDMNDLARYLLHYSARGDDFTLNGRRSLFAMATFDAIQLVSPKTFYPGTETYIRVLVSDPISKEGVENAPVSIFLKDSEGNTTSIGTGKTNLKGEISLPIDIPDTLDGSYALLASVEGRSGTKTLSQTVDVQRVQKLLLTTDKPIYQPGQTIHLRALSLKKPTLEPEKGKDVVFEVMDPKGNKVFKERKSTNDYGVAWSQFKLATLINMGNYKIRAVMDDTTTEKDITVETYTLPKFKVDATIDRPYYFPGDTLGGTISAYYFFGKKVQQGKVKILAQSYDVGFTTFQELSGETNEDGLYSFSIQLPSYFTGMPLEQGNGVGQLVVTVTDNAAHEETKYVSFIVAAAGILVNAVPEGGRIVLGKQNKIYVITTDPVGNPVSSTFSIQIADDVDYYSGFAASANGSTNASGIGEVFVDVPTGTNGYGYESSKYWIRISTKDKEGRTSMTTIPVDSTTAVSSISVLTDKAIYQVGDTMTVEIMAADSQDHVYLDLINQRQTRLTQILELKDGKASAEIDIDNTLSGELQLDAYYLNTDADVISGQRVVYIQHANQLKVNMAADNTIYKPADEAKLTFSVSDKDGVPVQTALAVYIVDEAVYALTEVKPGLLETYFELEEDLLNPRYQIKGPGFDFPTIAMTPLDSSNPEKEAEQQKHAEIALAAIASDSMNQYSENTWKADIARMKATVEGVVAKDIEKIIADITSSNFASTITYTNAKDVLLGLSGQWMDLFGKPYTFVMDTSNPYGDLYICSNGPDEAKDTFDDIKLVFPYYRIIHYEESGQKSGTYDASSNWGGFADMAAQDMGMEPSTGGDTSGQGNGDKPRIRKWFPETLYVAPSIITDEMGQAEVNVPLADSITTWRVSTMASSMTGQLGSFDKGLTVFQDFFIDIDFPATLTQNDFITVPIAIYNYLGESQTVSLEVIPEEWFTLQGANTQQVDIGANAVSVAYFPLQVKKIGTHSLTVFGYGTTLSDAVARMVKVLPNGKEIRDSRSGALKETVMRSVMIPADAIADSENLLVKIYPGYLSQVVEGLDSLLQLPYG